MKKYFLKQKLIQKKLEFLFRKTNEKLSYRNLEKKILFKQENLHYEDIRLYQPDEIQQ